MDGCYCGFGWLQLISSLSMGVVAFKGTHHLRVGCCPCALEGGAGGGARCPFWSWFKQGGGHLHRLYVFTWCGCSCGPLRHKINMVDLSCSYQNLEMCNYIYFPSPCTV